MSGILRHRHSRRMLSQSMFDPRSAQEHDSIRFTLGRGKERRQYSEADAYQHATISAIDPQDTVHMRGSALMTNRCMKRQNGTMRAPHPARNGGRNGWPGCKRQRPRMIDFYDQWHPIVAWVLDRTVSDRTEALLPCRRRSLTTRCRKISVVR